VEATLSVKGGKGKGVRMWSADKRRYAFSDGKGQERWFITLPGGEEKLQVSPLVRYPIRERLVYPSFSKGEKKGGRERPVHLQSPDQKKRREADHRVAGLLYHVITQWITGQEGKEKGRRIFR